jgi:anti-anti-sigma factor
MASSPDLDLDVQHRGGALVVSVQGEIDIATVDMVRDALRSDSPTSGVVVLDLRELAFVDTSGLRLITEEIHRAHDGRHTFRVVRGAGRVQRIFEVAGLADAAFWCDSVEEVLDEGGAHPAG